MPERNTPPRLLTIPQTAEHLGCSTKHVYRLIGTGDLRSVQITATGKRAKTRIREDDLAAFIDKRTVDVRRMRWGGVIAG